VDRLIVTSGDARATARALSLGEVDVALGAAGEGSSLLPAAPALFATYLVFQPTRAGPQLREAVERLVDRADLTRFFVRAPSVPMSSPLPPALMPQSPAPRAKAAAPSPPRQLSLLYDASLPDQRAVAERLQVKLHDAGYRISLRGLSRSALRTRWASGDFDLALQAVLLPPLAPPALAVVLELAGRRDLLRRELPPLGAITDGAARDARARERALALQPELPLIPLYAQGIAVATSPKVAGIEYDAFGVPLLDGAFFSPLP
jgi:MarR-like DNA-binding transcriptional regulator SgrR of sgrS sRNA